MNPVIKFKKWKRDRAKARLASKLRLQVVEVRNAIDRHKSFSKNCPNGSIWCDYLDSLHHAGTVLKSVEEVLLDRLKAVS